ncbi:NACHT, LRR and PYD domains-containing protein 3-like [Tyto alba]|uniref:NACHT, LRR and PYD domains-containing protein 3-like n=1 Tax=Tyto alba TaxID=56313 RepID=UPI0014040D52|nr:NACHT, LRR and PYD domains-containing protein 3-like [Tyto alba]XP_032862772.1 NACHT, LRR and PYD domains-containing protein 3-like [Tyto alba]
MARKNIKDFLLEALEDLTLDMFEKFKYKLSYIDYDKTANLSKYLLKKANNPVELADYMCDHYGADIAVDVAICVLEWINQRDTAAKLKQDKQKALRPNPPSASLVQDYKMKYREHVQRNFHWIKDMNARIGETVALNSRYTRLVLASGHRHEKKKEHEIMAVGQRHAEIMDEQMNSSIAVSDLFKPERDRQAPKTVVILGAAGIGKTTTVRKIILDWASEGVYKQFDYVFYIHCREVNLTAQGTMADMISKCCPSNNPPLVEILKRPEKLLFVIDGFDELRFSLDWPQNNLCSDPWEMKPVAIILNSLFRKILLPECSLLITTRPAGLQKLEQCLVCERSAEILGFSATDREEYFHKFFENKEEGRKVFQFVKGNEMVFTMCLVPITCWIVCTVMKQQLESGKDLAQTVKTTTGIYILYVSILLKSLSSKLKQNLHIIIKRLCCLAADGIWKQRVLFEEEAISELLLNQRDTLPLFLNESTFQKGIVCGSAYSFIHLSVQEFFASLFYVLEDDSETRDKQEDPKRDVKKLLENYENSRNDFMLTVRFLFGLLNKEQRNALEKETGCKIYPEIKEELLMWLRTSKKTALAINAEKIAVIHDLEACHCLYEIQDESFVKTALGYFIGIYLRDINFTQLDQIVLSFSIKKWPRLESLDVAYCSFISEHHEEHLDQDLANLSHLEKQSPIYLKKSPIYWLCQSLKDPNCTLKILRLEWCKLTAACCGVLAMVLSTNQCLTELRLRGNALGDPGVRLLCEGLKHSTCQLQRLGLWGCSLTDACCGDLATVLSTNQTLLELGLGANALGDAGVHLLCEGLKHPACQLRVLGLWGCSLTDACCGDLATVLSTNQTLMELGMGANALEDAGVRLLCEGLKHPACHLKELWLNKFGLNEETRRELAHLNKIKPSLKIRHIC